MSAAVLSRPLVSLTLPEKGVARYAMLALLAVGGTLLLTLAAKTKVVLGPVDLYLGNLAVLAIAAAYGMRLGLATFLLYLAEGAMGFPVFQSTPEKGIGIAYMMGTTGGYLFGMILATALVGWAADRGFDRNPVKLFAVMLVGVALILAFGFAWLATLLGVDKAWQFGVVPFVLADVIKAALAASLIPAVWALFARR
ncbi:MAG: biotin transporter BioY [Aquamicrobium sp.]|uniref:biotin transporter BioY n=1 Tax=Aquamicrobium sp. TaxID=1872579 RepID=UPI00349E6B78|nr:biotin transporter BioY [Aquamicrobium sp.]